MKKIIKIVFPEPIKKIFRTIENLFLKLTFGFTKAIILKDINDINFILYPNQKTPIRWLIERGAYRKEFSAMNQLIKTGDVVLDIGSHIGIVALFMAKKITEKGKVYSFEPFPDSYQKIRENIAINKFRNIHPYNFAMSDVVKKEQDFYYEPNNHELNSLGRVSNGNTKLTNKIVIPTNTIDNFCKENMIPKINFIKIDVEGYEINVLKGAEEMLSKKAINYIQFEISKIPLESIERAPQEIIDYLKSVGYNIFEFNNDKMIFNGPIDKINAGYDNYYASYGDLTKIV